MAERVKPRRRYHSPRRQEQAAATRLAILEAADRLFERQGYGTTTMAAIAAEAGVALKTVYLAFETKSGVLRALWNLRLRAGRDEVPIAQQAWYREVLEEPDPERQLRLNARNSRAAKLRIATVLDVIAAAAPLDSDIAALWDRIQSDYHANQRVIVESLNQKGALKAGLDIDRATDILWTINHPNMWHLLVGERAWTPDQYEQWTEDLARSQLLGRSEAAPKGGQPGRGS
jgi:AcrR family transcriptional regulator